MQVEIVTPTGSQHFQPENSFRSYDAVMGADFSVDVLLTVGSNDGSPSGETVVARFAADEVEQVIERSAG
ncbi:MAG: hypothetical protein ABJD68_08875 [Nakamurella sp.]